MGLRATLVPADAGDPMLAHLHPGVQGRLAIDGRPVGSFGAVHPELLDAWDLPQGLAVAYGELAVDALPAPVPVAFVALPRFPATSRDLSLDLAVELPAAEVVAALEAAAAGDAARTVQTGLSADDPPRLCPPGGSAGEGGPAIQVVEDYRGQGVDDGRRALLLRLGYRAAERTVTDDEVQALHAAIVEAALVTLHRRDPRARAR